MVILIVVTSAVSGVVQIPATLPLVVEPGTAEPPSGTRRAWIKPRDKSEIFNYHLYRQWEIEFLHEAA